jgi:amidase
LINFTQTDPLEDWPDRNTITWQNALALNLTQTSPNYTTALFWDKYLGSNATIEGAISMYNLDALIMPTSQSPGIAAIAGYPVVTVPLGYYPSNTTVTYNSRNTLVEGGPHFPFGLSFIGILDI